MFLVNVWLIASVSQTGDTLVYSFVSALWSVRYGFAGNTPSARKPPFAKDARYALFNMGLVPYTFRRKTRTHTRTHANAHARTHTHTALFCSFHFMLF